VTLDQIFLGLIAVAVLAMAAGQVAAVVLATRAMRRMGDTMSRVEQDIRPIVANVQAMSVEAKRATLLASSQVDRADRLMTDVSRRVEETMGVLQRTILAPVNEGVAIVSGIKAALSAFRSLKPRPRRAPGVASVPRAVPDPGDDDHASFIG
jgi:hypothetical protein